MYAFSPPTGDRRGRLAKLAVTRYRCAMDTLTLPLPELLGTSPTGAAMLSLAEQFDALRQQCLCVLEENAALRAGKAALEARVAGYRAPRK